MRLHLLKGHAGVEETQRTAAVSLVDKEEVGSVGATGMQSRFFENAVAEVDEIWQEIFGS